MRLLLRDRRTARYYAGLNQLAADPDRALDFGDVPSAARFALEQKLAGMELILRYDSWATEIPLPLLPEWCLFDERALRPVTH